MPEPKVQADAANPQLDAEGKPIVETPKPGEDTPPAKKPTAGEALQTTTPKPKDEPKMVPEAVFLEMKKENKELNKRIKAIEDNARDGASRSEIADEIDALGDEFEVDKKFLNKLTSIIETKVSKKYDSKIQPLEKKDRDAQIDATFNTHFEDAMADMPEYKGIVNKSVIKKLSLDPDNADKTFAEIIEEAYGSTPTGKRTIETTVPRGGKEPGEIDYSKAAKDPKYFDEIMSDPALKKKYNAGLTDRIHI